MFSRNHHTRRQDERMTRHTGKRFLALSEVSDLLLNTNGEKTSRGPERDPEPFFCQRKHGVHGMKSILQPRLVVNPQHKTGRSGIILLMVHSASRGASQTNRVNTGFDSIMILAAPCSCWNFHKMNGIIHIKKKDFFFAHSIIDARPV